MAKIDDFAVKHLVIKHRKKNNNKHKIKIKIAISNHFFPDFGYLPYSITSRGRCA